eukprot:1693881-Amphidinium_carterae.1
MVCSAGTPCWLSVVLVRPGTCWSTAISKRSCSSRYLEAQFKRPVGPLIGHAATEIGLRQLTGHMQQ